MERAVPLERLQGLAAGAGLTDVEARARAARFGDNRIVEAPEDVRPFISLQLGLADALHGFERSRARDVRRHRTAPRQGPCGVSRRMRTVISDRGL